MTTDTNNTMDIVAQALAAATAAKKTPKAEKTVEELAAERVTKDELRAKLADARKAERAERQVSLKTARETRRATKIAERDAKRAAQGAPKKPGLTSVEKAKAALPMCPADISEILALDLRGMELVIAHLLVEARERKIAQNTYVPNDGDLVEVVSNDPRLNAWHGAICKVTSARKVRSIIERVSDAAELYVLNGDIAPAKSEDESDEDEDEDLEATGTDE